MKILITGGAGFIGSNIADEYIRRGHKVVIVDDLSTGKKAHVNRVAKFYNLDIRSPKLAAIFAKEKPQVVNHHAAQKDLRFSVENPSGDAEINIIGGLNLLQNCVKHKVKKFIFASTGGAIYGDTTTVPTPDDYPAHPISPYGVAKLALENYLHYYHKIMGLPYVALRYANVYGPRQDAKGEAGVVAIFLERLKNGDRCWINGKGMQTRDFVYVKDVVSANVLALQDVACGSYNVGTGKETSVVNLYKLLAQAMGSSEKPGFSPAKKGEQARSALRCDKIKKQMGWLPQYSMEDGLRDMVR